MKLRLYTGLLWVLAVLRWLLKFGRWVFALFVIVMSVVRYDGFVDLAITALLLVVSWWGLGHIVSGIDGLGGWLWVAIVKIREPEAFEALAALSDTERQQLKQEMQYDLQGGAIGAKIRAFNRRELPKAEMEAMKERFRKAGF
jgi:hypothetical protein